MIIIITIIIFNPRHCFIALPDTLTLMLLLDTAIPVLLDALTPYPAMMIIIMIIIITIIIFNPRHCFLALPDTSTLMLLLDKCNSCTP
jgi:branched-subunit amino acid transport protein